MDQNKKACLTDRLYNVISSLRNQNSGADIHKVNNMRHTASLLIDDLASDDSLDYDCAKRIVENIENDLVSFFKDKYSYMSQISKHQILKKGDNLKT